MQYHIIIGTGVAGISAANTIREQAPGDEIILIGDEAALYYSRPGLAYYLSKELPEAGLYPMKPQDLVNKRIHFFHNRVTQILPQQKVVQLHDGNTLSYGKLLIATGASAASIQLPGIELRGVVKLDNMVDAQRMATLARKARAAVVIGGGITALEIVEGLCARGVKVHYFLRSDRYWSGVLDEAESRIIEHRLAEDGVQIHYHTEAERIVGKRGRVAGVVTRAGEKIPCQMVAVAVGIRPRVQLATDMGLKTDRGILVNEYLQTDLQDIYAAGDVAQVYDPLTGSYNIDSLWGPARQQGIVAGLNMAGVQTPYYKTAPFNVTRLAGLTTTIIGTVGKGADADLWGIARGDSETWRQLPDAIAVQTGFDVHRVRIHLGEKRIIGAVVMGDQVLSYPLQQLITQQTDVSSIRDVLLCEDCNISDVILDFWEARRQENEPIQP